MHLNLRVVEGNDYQVLDYTAVEYLKLVTNVIPYNRRHVQKTISVLVTVFSRTPIRLTSSLLTCRFQLTGVRHDLRQWTLRRLQLQLEGARIDMPLLFRGHQDGDAGRRGRQAPRRASYHVRHTRTSPRDACCACCRRQR